MRILVIDQCSNKKDVPKDHEELDETAVDNNELRELLEREDTVSRRAQNLYTGRQQRFVTEAIEQLTDAGEDVERYFVSAGFGLVPEEQTLPAYNVRFRNKGHAKTRGRELDLPDTVSEKIDSESYDLVFLPLGATYYEAIDLEKTVEEAPNDAYVVVFNRDDLAAEHANVISLTANTETGSKYGGGAIGVKGTYLKNFAANIAAGATVDDLADIERLCTTESTEQTGFERFEDT